MFFFNGRIRNAHVAPVILRDDPYTHSIGHSCVITTCLLLIIGLTLIITGVISETKKTTLIGIGVISIGVSLFITTIVCCNTHVKICYRNWAHGPPTVRTHYRRPQRIVTAAMSISAVRDLRAVDDEATLNSIITTNTYIHPKNCMNK